MGVRGQGIGSCEVWKKKNKKDLVLREWTVATWVYPQNEMGLRARRGRGMPRGDERSEAGFGEAV